VGLTYLDSCVVIYAVEDHPQWGEQSKAAITHGPDTRSAISPLVKLECLVGPFKHGDQVLAERFRRAFDNFDTLDMPEAAYLRASELRARFGLKTPDALHLACAQHHRCDALWTNDGRLNKASHGLARNIFA
jgi:predicted nucleic acid-binding protein